MSVRGLAPIVGAFHCAVPSKSASGKCALNTDVQWKSFRPPAVQPDGFKGTRRTAFSKISKLKHDSS